MKKNISSLLLVLGIVAFTTTTKAQTTEFDAMKMAQTDITGTARYMGMAGAFGALGGDVSAIKDNPAGLGVYRSWELTTTFNFLTQTSNSKWNGESSSDDLFKVGFNNFSLIMSFPTWASQSGSSSGLLQSNWGFSYNRLKNFNRNSYVRGNSMGNSIMDYYAAYTNGIPLSEFGYNDDYEYLPWMSVLAERSNLIYYTGDNDKNHTWSPILFEGEEVTPRYYLQERGYIDEYSISWAGNFSNTLYFGAAVNFQTVNYRMRSQYIEDFGNNEYMDLINELRTTGMGVSFDAGLIYRPTNFLRLGVSYKTPMRYILQDINSGDMLSKQLINEGGSDKYKEFGDYTGEADYDYEIRIPGKLTASAAVILGKKAIISGDFIYTNYRNIKMYDDYDGSKYYEADNQAIKRTFNNGYTFKLGAEYRLTDHFSLRAGFASDAATMKSKAIKEPHLNTVRTDTEYFRHKGTNYITAGLGYRGNYWYFDAAFIYKNLKEDFVPYNTLNSDPAKITTHNYDIVTTIGFRF